MKPFHDNHFDSIQALRGIAALFVLLEHIRFLNCGAFGVDIFFCISGFMIMFSTHKNSNGFLLKRAVRLLPLYYLMTVGTFFLLLLFPSMFEQTRANPVFLLKSLLFIPFDIGNGVLQPLMRIGWTVNCEVFFYLLFFISMKISHKYRGLISSVLLLGVVVTTGLINTGFAPLTFYGNPVMLEFIMGILSYYIGRFLYSLFQENKLPLSFAVASGLFACLLLIALPLCKPYVNVLGFYRLPLWGLPAMLIVLCFFIAGLYIKFPSPLVKLGNISYSLYLIHYYPLLLLDRFVFDFSEYTPFTILGVFVSVAVCCTLAYFCWYLIEKRFSGWLRKLC